MMIKNPMPKPLGFLLWLIALIATSYKFFQYLSGALAAPVAPTTAMVADRMAQSDHQMNGDVLQFIGAFLWGGVRQAGWYAWTNPLEIIAFIYTLLGARWAYGEIARFLKVFRR